MSRPARRFLIIVTAVVIVWAVLMAGYKYRRYAGKVLNYAKQKLKSAAPATASPPAMVGVLEIGGGKFTDVLGCPPYYLEVNPLDSVLFVTRLTDGGSNLIHVLDLKSGRDTRIATIADFGRNIGFTNAGFRDYVEHSEPGWIIAASETGVGVKIKTAYYLDLKTAKMDMREIFRFNPNGDLTNRARLPGF